MGENDQKDPYPEVMREVVSTNQGRGTLYKQDPQKPDTHITQLFCEVMDVVKTRRKLRRLESQLARHTKMFNVDSRIMRVLENEYERSLEDSNYEMKTVSQIKDEIIDAFLNLSV